MQVAVDQTGNPKEPLDRTPLSVHYSKGNSLADGGVHAAQPATNDAGTLGVQVLQEDVTAIQIVLVDSIRKFWFDVARQ